MTTVVATRTCPTSPSCPPAAPAPTWSGAPPACWSSCRSTSSPQAGGSSTGPAAMPSGPSSLWRRDLDELAEAFDGYEGDLKVQCTGPWTLAAAIELNRGEKVLADQGATRDLVGLAGRGPARPPRRGPTPGARRHAWSCSSTSRPSPRSSPAGSPPPPATDTCAQSTRRPRCTGLRDVLAAAPDAKATVVHCCDRGIPLPLLRATGAAPSHSTSPTSPRRAGSPSPPPSRRACGCMPGACRPTAAAPREPRPTRSPRGWRDAGMPTSSLGDLVATPACGLAGLTPEAAWRVQRAAVDVAAEWSERVREVDAPMSSVATGTHGHSTSPGDAGALAGEVPPARPHLGLELPAHEGRAAHHGPAADLGAADLRRHRRRCSDCWP